MSETDAILAAREHLWDNHPMIKEVAKLPAMEVRRMVGRVLSASKKSYASLAFCAAPSSGKTSCLEVIRDAVLAEYPGAGLLELEASEDVAPAEGRLLEEILGSIDYGLKPDRTLAGKRRQVDRCLIALSGKARHLFILVDEAQEFKDKELAWLKSVTNRLRKSRIDLTIIFAGQEGLKARKKQLGDSRPDLERRFISKLWEFHGCMDADDLKGMLRAADLHSEFPIGTSWSYTNFLMPRSFASGFRLENHGQEIWNAINARFKVTSGKSGLPLQIIADVLAKLLELIRESDAEGWTLSKSVIDKAVRNAT